jgi:phthalate 4,5-dioxygenase
MRAEQNELFTRVGPGTACGKLMRRYWQPIALEAELDGSLDPAMQKRPIKAVRALGQDFVLFKDESGNYGLLDRACPHRGADLSFARYEEGAIRCPFHGWKFSSDGRCLETPAEPPALKMCDRVRAQNYPLTVRAGVVFAWLGEGAPPAFAALDCFAAPASHSFAFKGLWQANWLQAFEVGIDPAHPSFLHRFLEDEDLAMVGSNAAGRQFRSAAAGLGDDQAAWPMSRIMREFHQPEIQVSQTAAGLQLIALRNMNAAQTHVRVTQSLFPHTFVIPLSPTLTITQMHLPVDDTHTYWYSFFTSFDAPLNHAAMREQRLRYTTLPHFAPTAGAHNRWGFNAEEQQSKTFLGMGEDDINVHDQWAVESMGAIVDRTREHLGTSDKAIITNRRVLQAALDAIERGEEAPGLAQSEIAQKTRGPHTVDGIAPADSWSDWWQQEALRKDAQALWKKAL